MLRGLNSETVDLIYLDPSFNSNREYAAPSGIKAVNANGESTRSNITRADAPATPKPTPEPSGGSNHYQRSHHRRQRERSSGVPVY